MIIIYSNILSFFPFVIICFVYISKYLIELQFFTFWFCIRLVKWLLSYIQRFKASWMTKYLVISYFLSFFSLLSFIYYIYLCAMMFLCAKIMNVCMCLFSSSFYLSCSPHFSKHERCKIINFHYEIHILILRWF